MPFVRALLARREVIVDDIVIHPLTLDLVIATHGRSIYILDAGHVKPDAAQHLLRPCPDDWLTAYPVSTVVNNARNEVAACVERQSKE